MKALLSYCYTGRIDSEVLKECKVELFKLADRCAVPVLKNYLAYYLSGDVTEGNVLKEERPKLLVDLVEMVETQ